MKPTVRVHIDIQAVLSHSNLRHRADNNTEKKISKMI